MKSGNLIMDLTFQFSLDAVVFTENLEEKSPTRWMVRLGLFLSFSYIGIVLAMRSNKDSSEFSLLQKFKP